MTIYSYLWGRGGGGSSKTGIQDLVQQPFTTIHLERELIHVVIRSAPGPNSHSDFTLCLSGSNPRRMSDGWATEADAWWENAKQSSS